MKITSPGLYREFDSEAYFADPCPEPSLSQSLCKILIEQSPLHAKMAHPRLAPPVDGEDSAEAYSKAQAIGNMAHVLMLKRGKSMAVIDAKNFTTKDAKVARETALNIGCEPILKRHAVTASAMCFAANEQLANIEGCERAFIGDGSAEVVIANVEDGLWLRSMIDWITPDLREVWDLKTSAMSASPYAAGKMMATAGWHIQAAMHERILDALDPDGAGRRKFRYVCQENEAPYALTVSEIGEAALTIGRKQIDYGINLWRQCIATDTWPAYPLRIFTPELPRWHENGWIEREIREEDEGNFPSPRPKMLSSIMGG